MSASHITPCPRCDGPMLLIPRRPLMRIFGDVRAFECSTCSHMVLSSYPFQSEPSNSGIVLRLDAAE